MSKDELDPYESTWSQIGATLGMLEAAIARCPQSLWERPSPTMGFWYLAYHTLFYLDHDLHPAGTEFASPDFDVFEYEVSGATPPYESPYTKADLLLYLERCSERTESVLQTLSRGRTAPVRGAARLKLSTFEIVLYELRHVQHHTAQLNSLLRAEGIEPPEWVRSVGGFSTPE
ncbi:MAG: DinB family protein [Longimicrobiales bacterium]